MPITHRTPSTDWSRIQQGQGKLAKGSTDASNNGSVAQLQTKLNGWLASKGQAALKVDGKFGVNTEAALKAFQKDARIKDDGVFGKDTFSKLSTRSSPSGQDAAPVDAVTTPPARAGNPNEGVAKFEKTYNAGKLNQGKEGKITVNGHTYKFVSGGQNRGNLPAGEYKVEKWRPKGKTQHVDGFGYSYRLLKKQDGKWVDSGIRDPRVGNNRSYFRIHPDGGNKGTWGCIGISGNKATQQAFKRDMDAAMAQAARTGRPYTFQVG